MYSLFVQFSNHYYQNDHVTSGEINILLLYYYYVTRQVPYRMSYADSTRGNARL